MIQVILTLMLGLAMVRIVDKRSRGPTAAFTCMNVHSEF